MSGDVDFTKMFEPPPPPPKPVPRGERRRRSFRNNIIGSLVVTVIIFSVIFAIEYPWGPGSEPIEETVTIPQGTDHQWEIETKGDSIYYSVEVVSGGNVDVIAAKFAYQDGKMGYFYLAGHRHLNVRQVDGKVGSSEDLDDFDLFVDNTNDVGAASTGDVTVNVIIEHKASFPLWILAIVAVIAFLFSAWAGMKRDQAKEQNEELARKEMAALTEPIPVASPGLPADTFCMDCGGQQAYDEASGALYCPRCGRWG